MKTFKIKLQNKVSAMVFVLACYCVLLSPIQQLLSQNLIAQYPFFMHKFNRNYLYLNYWDVSGNGKHGHSYNPYAITGPASGGRPGLYFENEPSSLSGANPTKDFKLKQGFFYENGNDKDKIPCLGKSVGDDAYVTIPKPKVVNFLNFSMSFWIRPKSSIVNMYIYRDKNYEVLLQDHCLTIRSFRSHIPNGGYPVFLYIIYTPVLFNGDWWFVNINNDGGVFKVQTASKPDEILDIELFNQVFDFSPPINDNYKAHILDNTFGGEVYNFRFANGKLDTYTCMTQDLNFLHKTCLNNGNVNKCSYLVDNPIAYYPLDGTQQSQWLVNEKGPAAVSSKGNITPTTDRFGQTNKALKLTGISNITLSASTHDLFKGYLDGYLPFVEPTTPDANGNCGNFTNPKGISFSFWLKITEDLSSPKSISNYQLPFSDADLKYTIFTAKNSSGQNLYGLQRIRDRLGLFRVTRIQGKSIDPWYLWSYDPVNFTNNQGWYHIVLSQDMDWLRLYVFKPGETEPIIQPLYMELDRLDEAVAWMIGSDTDGGPGIIDDFKVYNWPLYDYEVMVLHNIESANTSSTIQQTKSNFSVLPKPVTPSSFSIYPNPASDKLFAKIVLSKKADVQLSLYDLKGVTMFRKNITLESGENEVPIEIKNLSKGIYILKAKTPTDNYKEKVSIE